ncbi:MAG TPA: biopolymer transporter ExbD [Verrucomicrobiae bacterium]|jgi:biopolymer transport protein ExbD
MRFHIRKRRAAPAVIIVALIDVLVVLVIFLLVTTTFKQQPSLRLTLPESSQALKSGANDNPPLIVNIDAQGILRVGNDGLPMTLDQLQSHLREEAAKNSQTKLAMRADKNAPWGKIVSVIDAANAAHMKILGAYTKKTNEP